MGGKTYWVGENTKYDKRGSVSNEGMITNILNNDDDRICLRYN